jgi:hypothetical protein
VDKFKERKPFLLVEADSTAETTILNSTVFCLDYGVH